MGRIEYVHDGGQIKKATIYNNGGKKISEANLSSNGAYWELEPKNIAFSNAILRALDATCLIY